MKCSICGAEITENVKFCTVCGTPTAEEAPAPVSPVTPVAPVAPVAPSEPSFVSPPPVAPAPQLMGPWAYFGLQVLFSIPIVGFILLIVFSFDNSNLNRRNFARSYWCAALVGVVVFILLYFLLRVSGAAEAIAYMMNNLYY